MKLADDSLFVFKGESTVEMKGTEVPNPRCSSALDCTCCYVHSVLFLRMHSLYKVFRLSHALYILSCSFLCTVCSKVSDSLMFAMRIVLFLPMQSLLTSF